MSDDLPPDDPPNQEKAWLYAHHLAKEWVTGNHGFDQLDVGYFIKED